MAGTICQMRIMTDLSGETEFGSAPKELTRRSRLAVPEGEPNLTKVELGSTSGEVLEEDASAVLALVIFDADIYVLLTVFEHVAYDGD